MPTYIPEQPTPGLPNQRYVGADPTRGAPTRANPNPGPPGIGGTQDQIPENPSPGSPALPPVPANPMNLGQLPAGTLTRYGIYDNPTGAPLSVPANKPIGFNSDMQDQLGEYAQGNPQMQAIQKAMNTYAKPGSPQPSQGYFGMMNATKQAQLNEQQLGQQLNAGLSQWQSPGYTPAPAGPGLDSQQMQMQALKNMLAKIQH